MWETQLMLGCFLQEQLYINHVNESFFIKITYGKKQMVLGKIYRPPHKNISSSIEKLESTVHYYKSTLDRVSLNVCGDINLDSLTNNENCCIRDYVKLMLSYGLIHLNIGGQEEWAVTQVLLRPVHTGGPIRVRNTNFIPFIFHMHKIVLTILSPWLMNKSMSYRGEKWV